MQVCVGPRVSGGESKVLYEEQVFGKSVQRRLLAGCYSEFRTSRCGAQLATEAKELALRVLFLGLLGGVCVAASSSML